MLQFNTECPKYLEIVLATTIIVDPKVKSETKF